MTSFIKKVLDSRNRSKSPTKQMRGMPPPTSHYPHGNRPSSYAPMYPHNGSTDMVRMSPPSHLASYQFGSLPRTPHALENDFNADYSAYPATGYLPVPPSPLLTPVLRNSSRQSTQHSNESVGIHSWNTEKSDTRPDWRETSIKTRTEDNQFYLSKDLNSNIADPSIFDSGSMNRTRSHSPRKERKALEEKASRSKSPHKKKPVSNSLDYLNSQCHLEGCSAAIVVHRSNKAELMNSDEGYLVDRWLAGRDLSVIENEMYTKKKALTTRFLICRHQLCHASEYFKNLLLTHRRHEDIHIAVSGMDNPSPTTQFRWFVESCIPCPALKDISDDTLETCMRLARRFSAGGLEVRCSKFIIENASMRQPVVALCWLNWCLKHKFDPQVVQSCLPSVARLSLASLEQHRHMMSERVFADILAAKLRGCYEKAVHVFRTIHRMDHFSVDLDRCPRCGRTKDGLRVKVNADPCRKQLGCDRCHQEGCEIEQKAGEDLQAFYQCPHALLPLNDTTDDCHCQTRSLAMHLGAAIPARRPEDAIMNGNGMRKARSPERKGRKNTD